MFVVIAMKNVVVVVTVVVVIVAIFAISGTMS